MIKQLKITQLCENTAGGRGLLGEHGIAYFIEADGVTVLFDTGQGLTLEHNASKLSLPMHRVSAIALSHGHYDHAGGLKTALALTGKVPLYCHPDAFAPHFNRQGKNIGAPFTTPEAITSLTSALIPTQQPTQIRPGIWATGEIPRIHDIEDTGGPFYVDAQRQQNDPIRDDQAVFLRTPQGTVVLLGCGHSGVINTLEYIQQLTDGAPIQAVIGGTHLLRASEARLAFTLDALKAMDIRYLAPNHCTGLTAVCLFQRHFPALFHESPAGSLHRFPLG